MYVLGLDLETTGLDVEKDEIIEIGVVVWHVEERRPCLCFNALLRPTIALPPIITELTGITEDYLRQFSMETKSAYNALNMLMGKCDYVVAHNGTNFDKPFYTLGSNLAVGKVIDKPWIDTNCDIPYASEIKTRKLSHLAAEHKFINPFPHRAITDILTMLQILSQYDINDILKYQKAPNIWIEAMVTYDNRNDASRMGYHWNGKSKKWEKTIKDFLLQNEIKKSPFEIKVIK